MPDLEATSTAARPPSDLDVVVLHETNGRKYFEALLFLRETGRIRSLEFYEPSVLWKFAHSMLRERKPFAVALRQSLRNLRFRLTCWKLHDRVVLIGIAPWDVRLLVYAALRFKNGFIYHTSWPNWDGAVPKAMGALTPLFRRGWLRLLRQDTVSIAAATGLSGESAGAAVGGKTTTIIRHVVSDAFFASRARFASPFRLLFLGELSEKKGLPDLARVMDLLRDVPVVLDIVGGGPLSAVAAALGSRPGCKWHGQVRDRKALAGIVTNCQMLVSPSIRTGRWEELFGIAIIEAMAAGVPCIASDHVGPRSIITDGVDGMIVPERSPEQIAERIRRMILQPDVWESMSEKATVTAQQYSLAETARQWEQLLIAARSRHSVATVPSRANLTEAQEGNP